MVSAKEVDPGAGSSDVPFWTKRKGQWWCALPRPLGYVLAILYVIGPRTGAWANVYLALWCRSWVGGVVAVDDWSRAATEAGCVGRKAVDNWRRSIADLAQHGFIRVYREGHELERVLIRHPAVVLQELTLRSSDAGSVRRLLDGLAHVARGWGATDWIRPDAELSSVGCTGRCGEAVGRGADSRSGRGPGARVEEYEHVAERRLRRYWPDVGLDELWLVTRQDGFTAAPPTYGLILQAVAALSTNGMPLARTYAGVWLRARDGVARIDEPHLAALEAGFTDSGAVKHWMKRIHALCQLGMLREHPRCGGYRFGVPDPHLLLAELAAGERGQSNSDFQWWYDRIRRAAEYMRMENAFHADSMRRPPPNPGNLPI